MHVMAGPAAGRTDSHGPATLVRYSGGREPEPLVCQEPEVLDAVFGRELSYFVDCVEGRANDLLPVEDSIAALRMALACRDSALSGAAVELSL
jgi:predicted dehydrogenase